LNESILLTIAVMYLLTLITIYTALGSYLLARVFGMSPEDWHQTITTIKPPIEIKPPSKREDLE
jgi:hypothetical protein